MNDRNKTKICFDKVDRRLLLTKRRCYCFSHKMVEWIESFLSNRYQKVVIDGRVSFLALILSGVPQGTVLGAILLIIFINDITTCVLTSTIRCFAVSSCQDVSDLQKDFENIITWSDCNNMMMHEDKFESSSKNIQLVAPAPVYIIIFPISQTWLVITTKLIDQPDLQLIKVFVNNTKNGPLYRLEKWLSPYLTDISRLIKFEKS